jgi:hypothetical protein
MQLATCDSYGDLLVLALRVCDLAAVENQVHKYDVACGVSDARLVAAVSVLKA